MHKVARHDFFFTDGQVMNPQRRDSYAGMMLCRRVLLRNAITAGCSASALPAEAYARPQRSRHVHRHRQPRTLPVVVIDSGHGGKDPGCIGSGGIEEKTVVLELGRELHHQQHAGRRCQVAMTRETDVFVPLEQRVAFARRHRATVFVSLHANASHDHHARGLCVYRFAHRASDAQARALARWENSADSFGGKSFRHASPAVTHILASLMRRETWLHSAWLHSAWLQDNMVDSLRDHVRLEGIPARHARFVVLSAPDIPAVLVETGFLTNRTEARLLRSRSHRDLMAREMRQAIEHTLAHMAQTTHGSR